MDLDEADQWLNSSSSDGPSILEYTIDPSFAAEFKRTPLFPADQPKISGQEDLEMRSGSHNWDPKTMLTNLSFLEEKIHQLQNLVHLIAGKRNSASQDDLAAQQQQHLVTADVTSIIAQLISAAGSLLPSPAAQTYDSSRHTNNNISNNNNNNLDEHELKDEEDVEEGENLAPGSYEILQLEKEEILAPHTHFCAICGKGFKRDANLRMHMRGHGDEYKTAAALAKPHKELGPEASAVMKRYSCPFAGCKRNKDHKKFQPLKTILCVKNHYKRTHCDKSYACSRCKNKKFSVIADLKTHEKHCGKDKWLCSCGTTFSRKDKLFGHISLFQGHTPAIPVTDMKASGLSEAAVGNMGSFAASVNFSFGPASPGDIVAAQDDIDVKESLDDSSALFSPMNFETCNFGGFHEFPRPPYEDSESSFSFLLAGSYSNYPLKTVGDSNTNNLV